MLAGKSLPSPVLRPVIREQSLRHNSIPKTPTFAETETESNLVESDPILDQIRNTHGAEVVKKAPLAKCSGLIWKTYTKYTAFMLEDGNLIFYKDE